MSDSNEFENDQESDSAESTETSGWLKKVEELASDIAKQVGCVLYDVEFASRTLRIFIDRDPQASIQDCENVSRGLSEVLDEQNIVPGEHYQLEVSTPGLERSLKKDWHFDKAVGKKIRVRTNTALENVGVYLEKWKKTKTIEQKLAAIDDKKLVFKTSEGEIKIPLSVVEKAKVVFEMEKNIKKKH